jgi:outer membrane cobalamin receptor
MNTKIQLSTLLVLLSALHVSANELHEIIISSTQEETVFSSQKYKNSQEIRNTLPSNMISTANSSGIKIDGANSDFTSIYWNGIKVTDPSNTNAYPTFMNYGRNSSETLSIDGSKINYRSIGENYLQLQGGEGEYYRGAVSAVIDTEDTTHTFKVEGLSQKEHSSYSDERSSSSSEEKDRESSYSLSYLSSINFNEFLNTNIAYMRKKVMYDYDAAPKDPANYDYSINPDDDKANFETTANVGGIDFGYLQDANEFKADLQYTSTDGEHEGAYPSEYDSEVLRYGAKGATSFGIKNLKIKGSVYAVKESAKITSTFTNADEERTYNEYAASLLYKAEILALNLSYEKSYEDTNSFLATIKVPVANGFSLLAKYEKKGVNPTIFQEANPYGAANNDLKSQNLNRISGGVLYESKSLTCKIDYSQIETDDMIVWVTIDPTTFTGQYQNVDNTEYNFLHAVVDYTFLDDFAINLDYSNISNMSSSNDALVYNLPEHKALAKLEYFSTINAYFLASYMSEQNSYSGEVDASTTYNLGLGYNINDAFEVRADIYNLTDEYYEYVKNYPELGRIISAGINYTF